MIFDLKMEKQYTQVCKSMDSKLIHAAGEFRVENY